MKGSKIVVKELTGYCNFHLRSVNSPGLCFARPPSLFACGGKRAGCILIIYLLLFVTLIIPIRPISACKYLI